MTTQKPRTINQTATAATVDYFKRRGKLELLTGLLGANSLRDHNAEMKKNREAESAAVRRNVWGESELMSDDEMQQTILGDVTNPTPIVVNGNNSAGNSTVQTLATLALGGALGLGGMWLGQTRNPTPQQQQNATSPQVLEDTRERVELGLGKIEDYLAE